MIALNQLHDATLDRIEVFWRIGELTLHLRAFIDNKDANLEIKGQGLTALTMPRLQPWGPSDFINRVEAEEFEGGHRLQIEMQSGDVIEASVARYSLQLAPPFN
jgi:hypothetical protein